MSVEALELKLLSCKHLISGVELPLIVMALSWSWSRPLMGISLGRIFPAPRWPRSRRPRTLRVKLSLRRSRLGSKMGTSVGVKSLTLGTLCSGELRCQCFALGRI
jgi:hypothetical protein